MKNFKYTSLLILVGISLFLTSCDINETTEVTEIIEAEPNILFEERNVSFTTNNEFAAFIEFPPGFEIRDSDLVIAYRMKGIDANSKTAVWDALPKSYFEDFGTFSFNFNYSLSGIEILLDTQDGLDKTTLPDDFRVNQIFQFAILPSQFSQSRKILNNDFSYNTVSKGARVLK